LTRVENVRLVETGRPNGSANVLIILRRRAAELGIEIGTLLECVRRYETQTVPESLLPLDGQPIVLGRSNHLQIAKRTGDRVRAAGVRVTRARRRIVVAEETRQVRSLGPLVIDFEEQGLGQLMLDAEVPVLHVRHREVARDRVLCGRLNAFWIERGELLIRAGGSNARDIYARNVIRDRVRPVASPGGPFPSEVRVVENAVGATDHRPRHDAISEEIGRSEVLALRLGDGRNGVRRLARDRVLAYPVELTRGHVEAAHASPAMMRPRIVFVAQPEVDRQLAGQPDIVLEPEVV